MMYKVVNDPENEERSYIKVVDENNNVLVYLNGPMSMFAAGAFIKMLPDAENCIKITMEHWDH